MDDDSEQLARFEEMGEEAVRIHAIPPDSPLRIKDLRLNGYKSSRIQTAQ